jgi:hypothetical protein
MSARTGKTFKKGVKPSETVGPRGVVIVKISNRSLYTRVWRDAMHMIFRFLRARFKCSFRLKKTKLQVKRGVGDTYPSTGTRILTVFQECMFEYLYNDLSSV